MKSIGVTLQRTYLTKKKEKKKEAKITIVRDPARLSNILADISIACIYVINFRD